jgi:hypothetical protein
LLADVLEALWADPEVTAIDVSAELQREISERKENKLLPGHKRAA